LRICLVNTYHYRRGGASTYTFDVADLLRSRGHEVFHFAMKHRHNAACPEDGFFVDYVDYREAVESPRPLSRLQAFLRSLYSFEARSKFAALLESTRPDIIHTQNFRRHLTFSILGPAARRNIPVVFTAHDYDPVCPNSLLFAGGEVCEACRGKHYFRALGKGCKQGSLAGTLAVVLETYFVKAMRYFDGIERIITPSAFARSKFIEFGLDPERIEVIHNLTDISALEPSYEAGDYAVFFGRLAAEKGIDVLIDAAAAIGDLKVVIAGEGPLRGELEARRADVGAGNVEFLGYMDKEDLVPLVRNSMFVVVPSVWYENFPYSVLESFALGKPVIGSDIGGIPEMVQDGRTGFLVKPHDSQTLRARMLRLAGDAALRREMGRAARARVEREFSADIHYDRLTALYEKVLGTGGGPE
jgi:glycosyltransferase involved in cell wall biosynthesis